MSDPDFAPCQNCGRTFRPEILSKHVPICIKTSQKKRKVFESGKQRATGSDIPITKVLKVNQPPPKDPPKIAAAAARKNNWRQKHEEFIRNLRAAKGYQHALDTGGPLPPPPPATIDPDFIQCDYCGRRFNEKAAERHINFCKEKNHRISGPGQLKTKTNPYNTQDAKTKQAIRTQYQPPKPKLKPGSSAASSSAGLRQAPPDYERTPSGGAPLRTGKTMQDYMDAKEMAKTNSMGARGTGIKPGSGAAARYGSAERKNATGYSSSGSGSGYGGHGNSNGNNGYGGSPTYGSNSSSPAHHSKMSTGGAAGALSKFCHECGTKYATGAAKFCIECGVRRVAI